MTRRDSCRSRGVLVTVLCGASIVCGCRRSAADTACVRGIYPGQVIDVHLLEPYRPGGTFTFDPRFAATDGGCGPIDGLETTDVVRLQVEDGPGPSELTDCGHYWSYPISDVGVSLEREAAQSPPAGVTAGELQARLADGRQGPWAFGVVPTADDGAVVFDAPVPGQLPPAVFERSFTTYSMGRPAPGNPLCADAWAARVTRE